MWHVEENMKKKNSKTTFMGRVIELVFVYVWCFYSAFNEQCKVYYLYFSCSGIWNVPFISTVYLIRADVLKNGGIPTFVQQGLSDIDVTWARNLRDKVRNRHSSTAITEYCTFQWKVVLKL